MSSYAYTMTITVMEDILGLFPRRSCWTNSGSLLRVFSFIGVEVSCGSPIRRLAFRCAPATHVAALRATQAAYCSLLLSLINSLSPSSPDSVLPLEAFLGDPICWGTKFHINNCIVRTWKSVETPVDSITACGGILSSLHCVLDIKSKTLGYTWSHPIPVL